LNLNIEKKECFKFLSPNYRSKIYKILINLSEKDTVLDIGCGRGEYHSYINNIIGFDIHINDILNLKAINKNVFLADAEKIPIKNESIQSVICINTLEYIKNIEESFKEINRVLKKKGRFIFIVDNLDYPFIFDPVNFILHKFFKKHINFGAWNWKQLRRFKKEELISLLKKNGFSIKKTEFFNHHLISFLNFAECIFYNNFLSTEDKNSYMIDKSENIKVKKIPNFSIKILYKLSKIICNIDNRLSPKLNGANILIIAKKE